MEDNKDYTMIGDDWGNRIIREAIVKSGDKEALKLFDEEREEMQKRAEAEIQEMIEKGEI